MYEYNYDMLKSDLLNRGMERDFKYKYFDVGINNWKEGWQFSWKNRVTGQSYHSEFYADVSELLIDARLDGKTLKEIFEEDEQGADNVSIDFFASPKE